MSDYKPDIWRLQANSDVDGLIQALNAKDPGIRRRAAAALRALTAFDAIPALQQALDAESDPDTRENIVAALAFLQQEQERQTMEVQAVSETDVPSEVEILIAQLSLGNDKQIIEAAQLLGDVGDKTAVPALVELFNDPKISIKVRLAVAEALLKLESAPVEVALLGALRSPKWRIRRNGAAILGQLQASWAIEPLARALFDDNELVRKTAYAALKNIDTDEAHRAIEAARRAARRRKKRITQETQGAHDPELLRADDDPDLHDDDSQKIAWPSKRKPVNPSMAPTKPFDPRAIENARAELERQRREQQEQQQKNEDDE